MSSQHDSRPRGANFPFKFFFALLGLGVIAIYGAVSAHLLHSSPAFQASYGYGLSRGHLTRALRERGEGFRVELLAEAPTPDDPLVPDLAGIASRGPVHGVIVESVRAVLALVLLFFILRWVYHLSREERDRLSEPDPVVEVVATIAFIWVAVYVVHYTFEYHLEVAPKNLEQAESELWNFAYRPPVPPAWHVLDEEGDATPWTLRPVGRPDLVWELWRTEALWSHAGREWREAAAAGCYTDENGRLSVTGQAWDRMYARPYRSYLVYSAVMYWGVALPLLFCIVRGAYRGFRRVLVKLDETKRFDAVARLPAFQSAKAVLRNEARRFLLTTFALSVMALYEVEIGHYTLASLARIMLLVCILMLFSGAIVVGSMFSRYHNTHASWMETVGTGGADVPDDVREQMEACGAAAIVRSDAISAALVTLSLSALGVMGSWFVQEISPL